MGSYAAAPKLRTITLLGLKQVPQAVRVGGREAGVSAKGDTVEVVVDGGVALDRDTKIEW